jgi:signal transduction histidine kinase
MANIPLNQYINLLEIARDLASTLDLESLLNKIVLVAADLTDAEEASILLYDHKNNELRFAAASNVDENPELKHLVVPQDSIAGWTALHQEPVFVPDVHEDNRFSDLVEKAIEFKTNSIIAVPLITRNQLIGVLEVINKRQNLFSSDDLELLQTLSAQAAVAIQNSRLFEQSDLISDLVHELRTPLSSIGTIAYLLKQDNLSQPRKLELIDTIQSETTRLNNMVTSFLDVVRMEAGMIQFELEVFDFNELLKDCLFMMLPAANDNNITVLYHIPDQPIKIEADKEKIKQVLINLISNAIKYNRKNGKIWIKYNIVKKQFEFHIKDNGIGIDEEEKQKLFSKFFRSKFVENNISGTGLGLSICKQIIDNHNGNIWMQSEKSKGSIFSFSLPLN